MHPPPRASKKGVVKEHSGSQDHHIPCTITHQRRRNDSETDTIEQARKLNSEEVFRYLENLWLSFPREKKRSFTYIDPLWYTLYWDGSNKEKVLSWITKEGIFSRKYVFVPIVQWNHWSLLIFCHFGESSESKLRTPCILWLDSLEMAENSKQHEPVIRKFVSDIYRSLGRTEYKDLSRKMPFLVPKVPQQKDIGDCGFLVLYYIKLFVESAPKNFSLTNGYPYFMKKDWFNSKGLDGFRKTLHLLHI